MTLSFVNDTSPLKEEATRLKNLKYLVGTLGKKYSGERETILALQSDGTQHVKCYEFLYTTACGFPEVGVLPCLYFWVSLRPPL